MKMQTSAKIATVAAAVTLAGCFTLSHTEYPRTAMSRPADGRDVAVALGGFDAVITSYVPVYGYETVYRPGGFRRRPFGYYETYSTTTYYPQANQTTAFIERAQDLLEKGGFTVSPTGAAYRVEVRFDGPYVTDGERTAQALWLVLSALSADYGVQTWTAQLRIYDAASNKLVMSNDYTQRYQAVVWGPFPIFSPACSDQTEHNTMQCWCLNALTDRAMADASAFMSAQAAARPAPAAQPASAK